MKMVLFARLMILTTVFAVLGCSYESKQPDAKIETNPVFDTTWTTYSNEELNIRFDHPPAAFVMSGKFYDSDPDSIVTIILNRYGLYSPRDVHFHEQLLFLRITFGSVPFEEALIQNDYPTFYRSHDAWMIGGNPGPSSPARLIQTDRYVGLSGGVNRGQNAPGAPGGYVHYETAPVEFIAMRINKSRWAYVNSQFDTAYYSMYQRLLDSIKFTHKPSDSTRNAQ